MTTETPNQWAQRFTDLETLTRTVQERFRDERLDDVFKTDATALAFIAQSLDEAIASLKGAVAALEAAQESAPP